MRSRPIAWFCCLLTALAPTLVVVSVAEHGHEHREAAIVGHGHSHDDGHVPHRDHDGGGDPIPVSSQTSYWTARPASGETLQVPPAVPMTFFVAPIDTLLGESASSARGIADRRSRSPTVPSPGDILPLRI